MKYILLPIHPEWCEKILNGDKSIEVRKGTILYKVINKLIKEQGKAPCLMYCTKGEDFLIAYEDYDYDIMDYCGSVKYGLVTKNCSSEEDEDGIPYGNERDAYDYYKNDFNRIQHDHEWILNGKVIAEFEASAEQIIFGRTMYDDLGYFTDTLHDFELLKKSCLTKDDMRKYLKVEDNGVSGTAIHVHNLKVFDKPKELWEFDSPNGFTPCKKCLLYKSFLKGECKGEHCNSLYKAPQSWCYAEAGE